MSARKYSQFATRLLATASVLCLPVLHHSAAQDQPAAAPAGGLEEIVVVAQKRSVNIQKAPEAITAVTSTQLDQASPTMPNGIGEPIEEAGIDFAPDGSVWAAFTKDTCTPTAQPVPGVPALSCDGDFQYSNTRYLSVVAHLS